MKTKIRKYFSITALLIVATIGLSSCEITYYDDYNNNTDRLCGPTWTDIWDEGYRHYEQRFIFYTGGRGIEIFYDNGVEWRYDFYWHWANNERTIVMAYGPNKVSYFNDVIISRNILSGYLNDEYVEFRSW